MKRKNKKIFGEMAERSNAAVLKTVEVKASGGSNPSLSATQREVVASLFVWRRERVTKKHRGSDKERSDDALAKLRAQRRNGSISLSAKKDIVHFRFTIRKWRLVPPFSCTTENF